MKVLIQGIILEVSLVKTKSKSQDIVVWTGRVNTVQNYCERVENSHISIFRALDRTDVEYSKL